MSKDYYKEIVDWSMVKEGDAVEVTSICNNVKHLVYFVGLNEYNGVRTKTFSNSEIKCYEKIWCSPMDKSCIKHEIDWSKVPVDAKVITGPLKLKRHFKCFKNNKVYVFGGGQTSFSTDIQEDFGFTLDSCTLIDDENVTTL